MFSMASVSVAGAPAGLAPFAVCVRRSRERVRGHGVLGDEQALLEPIGSSPWLDRALREATESTQSPGARLTVAA